MKGLNLKVPRIFWLVIVIGLMLNACAYYNTYYNAEQKFELARKQALRADGKPNATAVEYYNSVIKKCGVILTDYKNSRWADDALFLLAKALYYHGNNNIQAIEKWEDLIKFYPNCEFVPEARLYIASAKYEMNQKKEAHEILRNFLNDEANKDLFAQCLLQLADYSQKEKDFVQSQSYLTQLLEKYPDSKEYTQAYIMLGKSYFNNNNNSESVRVFQDMLKTRIDKKSKLDAQYYIAYNYLLMKDYDKSGKLINQLLKNEYRTSEIAKIQMLKARNYIGLKEYEEGQRIFDVIIKDNARTSLSAEANFYIAELYFTVFHDYPKAIEYYNKVKVENATSEFVEKSVLRSAVAGQIIQYQRKDRKVAIKELINEQFKLAEYYIDILTLPDSAIVVYSQLQGQRHQLRRNLDSLNVKLTNISALNDTLNKSLEDSLKTEKKSLETDISLYDREFLPFSLFVKAKVYKEILKDSLQAAGCLDSLKVNYPDNKYTYATELLMRNEPVELTTPGDKAYEITYQQAVDSLEVNPQNTLAVLKQLALQKNQFYEKTKFTIGYICYFVVNDTIQSKENFDVILALNPDSDYSVFVKQFYDGKKFVVLDQLPYLKVLEENARKKAEEDIKQEEPVKTEQDGPSSEIDKDKETDKDKDAEPEKLIGDEKGQQLKE